MNYTIQSAKAWNVEPRNGKHAYSVTFEEAHSEPVDYFSATEPKVGDKVEGTIKPSEKGRMTFYEPYKLDRHQANIMSQWAVRLAAEQHGIDPRTIDADELGNYVSSVSAMAETYLDMAMDLAERVSE